jgi:DedD protein
LASDLHDDGFHEIQLNGKQLVFLFMAATVVSVVIFLCGVLVGRGVKTERIVSSSDAPVAAEPAPKPAAAVTAPPAAGSDPTVAPPPPAVDELTYFNRLEKKSQPLEDLRPTAAVAPPAETSSTRREKAAPAVAPPTAAPVIPAVAPPAPRQAGATPSVPGDGYVVQVAALPEHDADTIARRLSSKGYGVFVVAPGVAAPALYRVRVGKFKTRREAEAIASKLQKEEQFKPWITR